MRKRIERATTHIRRFWRLHNNLELENSVSNLKVYICIYIELNECLFK